MILRDKSGDILFYVVEGVADFVVELADSLIDRDELFHIRECPTEILVQFFTAVIQKFGVDFSYE
jgi:hypothetical protein